jgi:WD40 repeat protein
MKKGWGLAASIGGLVAGVLIYAALLAPQDTAEHSQPPVNQIPDLEIAFGGGVLHFIHPDGSGHTSTEIVYPTDNVGSWYRPRSPGHLNITSLLTWSPDGEYLAAEVSTYGPNPGVAYPVLISSNGDVLMCPDGDLPYSSPDSRVWVVSGTQVVTIYNGVPLSRAILVDMATCEYAPLLVGGEPLTGVHEVTVSTRGWLAASYASPGERIRILTPEGEEAAVIPNGAYPAWSRDGEWLAYIAIDGIWIVRKDGSDQRRIWTGAGRLVSPPSWSPDGEWIVFDDQGTIYKVNIETGEAISIFDGGVNPIWRWGLGSDNGE